MKTKIIIGLLSATTVGATAYAVVENNIHNNEINLANNTIAQYGEQIENQRAITEKDNQDYNDIIERLEIIEKNIDSLNNVDYSTDINKIKDNVKTLETSISSIKNDINKNNIIGQWKHASSDSESIYEFKSDGTFYINNEYAGIYTDYIFIRNFGLYKMLMFYSFIDDDTIKYYFQPNGNLAYYYEYTLEKIS